MLAGGRNRRFGGRSKGLELVGETRIIDRAVSALRTVCSRIVLAANEPDANKWLSDVAVLPDSFLGAGGLAGVHAALGHGDILVAAWDMPFVSGELLKEIHSAAVEHDADLVVPESEGPRGIEPFCAFYSARLRPRLSAFLAGGGRAAHEFAAQMETVRIPLDQVRRFGSPDRIFFSVNTIEDLRDARALVESTR